MRGESPKALRIFFRPDQKLFASVSSLISSLIRKFYRLAAGSPLLSTASVIALQPFGDFLRPNAHWHALVLEGGFSPDGRFLFLPIQDTQKLTEIFRRALIKLFLSKALITEEFASTLCSFPMKVLALITDPQQCRRILLHLIKTDAAPPGLDASALS